MSQPTATLIVTTYNQPKWLQRCLLGFAHQDRHDFELIVADDGSNDKTRAVVDQMHASLPYALHHVWQEDDGFRKCRIMNQAIVEARSDYLIFTDGDCVPKRDFVSQHLKRRATGRYLSGGYVKLPQAVSEAIDEHAIAHGLFCDLAWLKKHGLTKVSNKLKHNKGWRGALFNTLTTVKPRWHGHNGSVWKADALRVNGFDERMGYWGEDLEFGVRLTHAGVRGKQVRHHAIVVHLDHPRGYVDEAVKANNRAMLTHTKQTQRIETPNGIRQRPNSLSSLTP